MLHRNRIPKNVLILFFFKGLNSFCFLLFTASTSQVRICWIITWPLKNGKLNNFNFLRIVLSKYANV